MIEITKTIPNPEKIVTWLENIIKPHLVPDVSNYAKGRLKTWLGAEPTLTSPTKILQGTEIDDKILKRLAELIEWDFDFCLVTYSGDENAIGISPHRDASFADYEAIGVHLSEECLFNYWMGREEFGKSPNKYEFNPHKEAPTHSFELIPGQVIKFNCKNFHSASPSSKRWNLNFWKKKP